MHLDFWDGLIDFGPFLSLFIIFHFRNLVITMVLLLLSVANLVCHATYCRDQFVDYWMRGNLLTKDLATRIYIILKRPDRSYLSQVRLHFY